MNIPFFSKKPSVGKAYCTAPFTSLVVDPNKNVRPCCTFEGSLGNLQQASLTEILGSASWNEVKRQITQGETPKGCVNCYEREQATGWSVRTSQYDPRKARTDHWTRAITQLEINSSNICNLACTHCTSQFSSRWVQLNDKFGKEVAYHHIAPEHEVHGPDPENIVRQIAALDLSRLEQVRFKGGEPMLNHDVPAVLHHLLDRGILQKTSVMFVSNGSLLPEKILALLRQAGSVHMCISVDGMGSLQEYIRRGPSEITRIERFIDTLSSLGRISFSLSVSVMVYNVFSLDTISAWWNGYRRKSPEKFPLLQYGLHVVEPAHLSVSVLQDSTRDMLIAKYSHLSGADYTSVIHSLRQPFAGAALHNEFVAYTRDMDKVWGSDVLQVVPELAPEMVRLAVAPPPTPQNVFSSLGLDSPETTLRKGMSFSKAGDHEAAVRLYNGYLEAISAEALAMKWEIRLHRAIVLGRMEQWDQSHEEFYSLARVAPHRTLQALQRSRPDGTDAHEPGGVLGLISQNLGTETGFVQAPSFRLLMEGLSYRALDDATEAAARLDKALELDPEYTLAKVARREMEMRVDA